VGKGRGLSAFISSPFLNTIEILNEKCALVTLKRTRITVNTPLIVGAVILERSKNHVYELWYNFFKRHFPKIQLLFTDTDSFCVRIEQEEPFDFIHKYPQLFDTSNFSKQNAFGIQPSNAIRVGRIKLENGTNFISSFIGLRPKLYSILFEDKTNIKKAKGVGKACVRDITHETYKHILRTGEIMVRPQLQFYSHLHTVTTREIDKVILSSSDTKRYHYDEGKRSYCRATSLSFAKRKKNNKRYL